MARKKDDFLDSVFKFADSLATAVEIGANKLEELDRKERERIRINMAQLEQEDVLTIDRKEVTIHTGKGEYKIRSFDVKIRGRRYTPVQTFLDVLFITNKHLIFMIDKS